MLTVEVLIEELGLRLAAGADAARSPIRWVHITELPDPTPWLSGGELLLTTGIQLPEESEQREFIGRLASHQLSGLGFGTGFDHPRLPDAMVAEAEARGFPLFEVPYSMPFIAITEKAFTRLVNEQYAALQRGIAVQKRLESLVLEQRGLTEIARALAAAVGGWVTVLRADGEVMASQAFRRQPSDEALAAVAVEAAQHTRADRFAEFVPEHPELAGRAAALPVVGGPGSPAAWLVACRDGGAITDFERLILQQAAVVVALELMREQIVLDTERRLAGDVLAEVLAGRLSEAEILGRLAPFGIAGKAAFLVFGGAAASGAPDLEAALADAGVPALVAHHAGLLCAIVTALAEEQLDLAASLLSALDARGEGRIRAAASRSVPIGELRRAFHEARCALEATAMHNGTTPEVASWRDLGAYQLLLSVQDDEALSLYCESVLGPITDGEGEYGGELLRSLETFIEANGQWERAARLLFCHRHTLRYRIKRIEELTGRDLGRAHDRIEFWLALRGRELVG